MLSCSQQPTEVMLYHTETKNDFPSEDYFACVVYAEVKMNFSLAEINKTFLLLLTS